MLPGDQGQAVVLEHPCAAVPSGQSPAFIHLFGVFLQEQELESVKLEDLEKEARAF